MEPTTGAIVRYWLLCGPSRTAPSYPVCVTEIGPGQYPGTVIVSCVRLSTDPPAVPQPKCTSAPWPVRKSPPIRTVHPSLAAAVTDVTRRTYENLGLELVVITPVM